MRNRKTISYLLFFGCILLFAGILLAQNTPDRNLIVNGKDAGMVVQVGGHAYVDVETVAQFTNGSVTLEPTRVVLNFPTPGASNAPAAAPAPQSEPAPPPPPGLSRNFASLAIAELAEMREWRGAVGTILTYGIPATGTWPQDYHDRVQANLSQVGLAVATDADQQAMELLENEFSNLAAWADSVISTGKSWTATKTVSPDVMQSDSALAKVSSCSRFLSSMLLSGTFSDDQSCH